MTLNQLRYFCTASRCHSITKAAEELYVTQPTVSVAIRDLEIEFGISLFYRKGNRLILTEEGEELYNKATYILQYCTELQADYSSMARVKPPLRIGIPPMLSTVFFPELLIAFHDQYPEIAVVLEEYGSVRACNLVQDDTLDLALVNMEQYNIDKFNKALLANDQVVFCVSDDHRLADPRLSAAVAVGGKHTGRNRLSDRNHPPGCGVSAQHVAGMAGFAGREKKLCYTVKRSWITL